MQISLYCCQQGSSALAGGPLGTKFSQRGLHPGVQALPPKPEAQHSPISAYLSFVIPAEFSAPVSPDHGRPPALPEGTGGCSFGCHWQPLFPAFSLGAPRYIPPSPFPSSISGDHCPLPVNFPAHMGGAEIHH